MSISDLRTALLQIIDRRLTYRAAGGLITCALSIPGCDSALTKPTAETPSASSAPLNLAPTNSMPAAPTYVAASRAAPPNAYSAPPPYQVQQASYTAPRRPIEQDPNWVKVQGGGGPGLPASTENLEFVPGIEDLQIYEGPLPPGTPQGWGGGEMLNWTVGKEVRANPLPHSP